METVYPALPEVNVKPLGDIMLDFLIAHDNEEPFLDFKETLGISKDSPFSKIAKDFFAFSNYGGGFLLIGFKERPKDEKNEDSKDKNEPKRRFIPVGLPDDFYVEPASLQEKFNAYSSSPITIDYNEFVRDIDGSPKKFAAIYIPPATSVLRPTKRGSYIDVKGKERISFEPGVTLFRRGTQSIIASDEEIAWIEKRAQKEGYRLSVLSGQPDQLQETIYSNLFEISKIPKIIWTGTSRKRNYIVKNTLDGNRSGIVYIYWDNKLITFHDISQPSTPLWNLVEPQSIRMEGLADWLSDTDKCRGITFLLNKELSFLARDLNLRQEVKILKPSNKQKLKPRFYFSCEKDNKIETWTPRFRKNSKLTVAQKMWSKQLNRPIW